MTLFKRAEFISHSGIPLDWKIECDELSDEDLETLAFIVSKQLRFTHIHGIPRGGLRFASVLEKYREPLDGSNHWTLIVDDVLTTGRSMKEAREKYGMLSAGVVIFDRGVDLTPFWIYSLFRLNSMFYHDRTST